MNCNNYLEACVWDALTDILDKYKMNRSKSVATNKVLLNSFYIGHWTPNWGPITRNASESKLRHILSSQVENCNNYPKACVWDALTDMLKKYKVNMSKNVTTNKVLRNSFRAKIAHILRIYLPVNLK